jgi:quinol monooxygenase YgiN
MAPFLASTPPTMATGFDLTHYTEDSGFLAKIPSPLNGDTCGVIHDTKIACASPAAAAIVRERLRGIAEHAERNEEGTYTFLVLKSLDSEDHVRIFERYRDWEALAKHQGNPAWAKLLLESKEEIKSLERRAYAPNRKGWLQRPGARL